MALFLHLLGILLLFSSTTDGKTLVVSGGSESYSNPFWDQIIENAGGSGARMGVISAASSTPEDSGSYYVDLFLDKGVAEAIFIPIHEDNLPANEDPDVIADIARMTGFFFSGGDQARVINSFYHEGRVPSSALLAIQDVYEADGMVSGSSAGTVCQPSTPMIMSGYSYEALLCGGYKTGENRPPYALEYDPDGGLDMLDDYILDSHASERGREARLIRLLADTMDEPNGAIYGMGIDEGTSVVISDVGTPQAEVEVFGPGGVMIPDLSNAVIDEGGDACEPPYYHIANIMTTFLTEGDRISLQSHDITWASWKSNIQGQESLNQAPTSEAIFDGDRDDPIPEFVQVATGLFDNPNDVTTWGRSSEGPPRFRVDFSREDPNAEAVVGISPRYGHRAISYTHLRLEMYADDE